MDKLLNGNVPIYVQIMDAVKHSIVSGELKPGDKIMSVRDMASHFGVNPNTIQRALLELEREGLLAAERAQGRYVAADENAIENLRKIMAEDAVKRFKDEMQALGYGRDEIKNFWR